MLLAALPILIELFTSEGCSSCPPADAVLARLHEAQPVPGVQLVVLSEHVDYWNDLGWRDPFSDAVFSDRQTRYGGRVYTPQAMVDGRFDVLGSDEQGIRRAAAQAAAAPHGQVTLDEQFVQNVHFVQIAIRGIPPHAGAQVVLAVLEDGLTTQVARGENAGRTLHHTAVVRALKRVATLPAGQAAWSGKAEIPSNPAWKNPRLAVFVEDARQRSVLASAAR